MQEILQRTTSAFDGTVETVSCDEAYMMLLLDGDDAENSDAKAMEIAEGIRKEIFETTRCTASIGIGDNKFLSKLATDKVKPNGAFIVKDYHELLRNLRLRDLHGIGWRSEPRLAAKGLNTVRDVWDLGNSAQTVLRDTLGPALGTKIFEFCHGRDDRPVQPAKRKTIGAEVRTSIAFSSEYHQTFVC